MQDAVSLIKSLDVSDIESRISFLQAELLGWKTILALKRVVEHHKPLDSSIVAALDNMGYEMEGQGPADSFSKEPKNVGPNLIRTRNTVDKFKEALLDWADENAFSTAEAAGATKTSKPAAIYFLKLLEKEGVVVSVGRGVNSKWVLRDGRDPQHVRTSQAV